MNRERKVIRAEDAAEPCTVDAWRCKACQRVWTDERAARYCHATEYPCECGGRHEKTYTVCKACRERKDAEKWYAKPAVEWDGSFPIGLWDGDKYFFDADSLLEYLEDREEPVDLESLRLTNCKEYGPPRFEMAEFLSDYLPEDDELDTAEIDKIVNDWINKQRPLSYIMTGKRLDIESVRRRLVDNVLTEGRNLIAKLE